MAGPDFPALWRAFRGKDGREHDRVIVGVAAAFAHVALADGHVDPSETARFLDVARGSRLVGADEATAASLTRAFEDLVAALLALEDHGRAECLRTLSDFGFDTMRREIVWSATHAALLADAQLSDEERRAETDVREALRIRSSVL